MNEVSIDIGELRKRKIMIATPMYGGMCGGQYTRAMIEFQKVCSEYEIQTEFFFLFNESLITRARNYCVDEFMRSDYTHLMFIDADIGFNPHDVLALAAIADPDTDKDIVCGAYPKKVISWEKIKRAVDKGFADENPQKLENYVGDYVFNPADGSPEIPLNEPVEVLEGGTGFMMIQRKAFEKYEAAYPEFKYLPDHVRSESFDGTREIMAYFDCVIEPKSKRYLSEDYMFCQWSRNAGIKVWMCPWMRLNHTGSYQFGGSLIDLANIGVSATADPNEKLK
jgi:hypothetical protein|tara:strand:+ start:123 stop:965 length:843 start_codon:yes stop_codon:yes gene_type:complete